MRVTGKKTEYNIDAHGNITNRYQIPTGLYIDDNSVLIDAHGFPTGYYWNSEGRFINRNGLKTGLQSNLEGQIYRELSSATPEQDSWYRSNTLSSNFFSGGMTEPNAGRSGYYWDPTAVMSR